VSVYDEKPQSGGGGGCAGRRCNAGGCARAVLVWGGVSRG